MVLSFRDPVFIPGEDVFVAFSLQSFMGLFLRHAFMHRESLRNTLEI